MTEEELEKVVDNMLEDDNLSKEELEKKYGKIMQEEVSVAPTSHTLDESIVLGNTELGEENEISDKNIQED